MTGIAAPPRRPLPPALRPWRLYLLIAVVVALLAVGVVALGGGEGSGDAPLTGSPAQPQPGAPALADDLVGRTSGTIRLEAWSSTSRYADAATEGILLAEAEGWVAPDGTLVLTLSGGGSYGEAGLVRPGGVNDLVITPAGDALLVTGDDPESIAVRWLGAGDPPADPGTPAGFAQGLTLGALAGLAEIAGKPMPTERWADAAQYVIPAGEFPAPAPGLLRWSRDRVDNAEAWVYTAAGDGTRVVVLDVVGLDPVVLGPVTRYTVALTITAGERRELPDYLAGAVAAGPPEIPAAEPPG